MEEAGLETEGMVESTAKLREEILALSGVDIMENANEFKSTYKIMDELAAKWENLTDIQQASVTELIAGKRQGNIVSSLMTNFDTARDALETSLNSSGSAMREHEKWQESLEAQILKLKASWQSLSQAFLSSDFLKTVLSSVIKLVDGITTLIDKFGVLPTFITAFGAFQAFKGKGFFKPIIDEATGTAQGITTIFNGAANNIKQSLSKINISGGFTAGFNQNDTEALTAYSNALNSTMSKTEAWNSCMANASAAAQEAARSNEFLAGGLNGYIKAQQTANVSTLASNKSIGSARVLLKEYYSGLGNVGGICKTTGMSMNDFRAAVAATNPQLAAQMTATGSATTGLYAYTTATIGAKVASIGLKIAVTALNVVLTMGIGLIVSGVVSAISSWANKEEELAEQVDELTSKYKEQHKALTELKGDYDTSNENSMISKYAKLSKGVDSLGRNVSLTADEYSEYQDIVNQVANQIPSLVAGYTEQGNALLNVKGNVEELTKAYEKLVHAENVKILGNSGKIEEDFKNSLNEAKKLSEDRLPLDFIQALELIRDGENAWDIAKSTNFTASLGTKKYKAALKKAGIENERLLDSVTVISANDAKGFVKQEARYWSEFKREYEKNPSKINAIIDNYYAQFDETVEGYKSIAQSKLSEAFDVSEEISGLNYRGIGEELQLIAHQLVNDIDFKFVSKLQNKGESMEQWTTKLLDQLNNISKVDAKQVETGFDLQTKFNGGDISYGEYIQGLKDVEETIDKLKIDEEIKSRLKLSLGLDDEGAINQYDALINRVLNSTKDPFSRSLFNNDASLGDAARIWSLFNNGAATRMSMFSQKVAKTLIKSADVSEEQQLKEIIDNLSSEELSLAEDVIKNFDPISKGKIQKEFDEFEKGGNVDLALRPKIDSSVLKDAGWKNAGEDMATLFTSTFSNAAGDVAMNFTPIVVDEDGKHIDTLSPEALQKYAEGVIAGTREDDLNLQIGAKFEGIDAVSQAVSAADQIHRLQDYYYNGAAAQLQDAIDRALAIQGFSFDLNMEVETAGIEALNTALAESVSGAGLSAESVAALKDRYKDLEADGYNLSAMFEETSNGIHLNRKSFRELEKAYAQGKQTEIAEDLTVLKKEYDLITQEIEDCNDASERASLYVQRDTILQQINDAATLASQYQGLTSAYNDWLAAEEAGQERDMYEKLIEGFENVDDEISRGWLDDGTIEFLELLSGKDLTTAPIDELKQAYDDLDKTIGKSKYSVRDFFTVNEDGESTNTGVYNFLETIESFDQFKDVIKRNEDGRITGFDFEVVAEKDGKGNVIKNGDQVIAEALGISEELVQIMLRASDDAGFVINLDGAYTQLANLKTEAEAARDSLAELKEAGQLKDANNKSIDADVNFDFNAEGQELVAEQAKALKLLEKFKKNGVIDLKMVGAQEALDVAEYLTIKIDDLTEPKYMQIDTSTLEDSLEEPVEKMQEFERLVKEKHLLSLTGDTEKLEDVNAEMDEIAEYLYNLNDKEVKAKLDIKGLDTEEIKEKLESGEIELDAELNLDVEMSDDLKDIRLLMMKQLGIVSDNEVKLKIKYDLEDSVVEELTDSEQEVVVKYFEEHEEVKNYEPEQKQAVVEYLVEYGTVDQWSPQTKEAFVKYFVDEEELKDYTPEQKQALAVYIADGNDVSDYTPEMKQAIAKYLADGGDVSKYSPENKKAFARYLVDGGDPEKFVPPDKDATVNYAVNDDNVQEYKPSDFWATVWLSPKKAVSNLWNWVTGNKGNEGDSEVNGTANVNGTTGRAFKQGSWGTKNSGTALVGEIGREVLVRDGKYYTIGDNGAEFIKYKKGDIIFNHVQSEQLFKNGKVTANGGRAKALVNGTAFAQGTAFVGGSGGSDSGLGKITKDVSAIRKETEGKSGGSKGSSGALDKNEDGKSKSKSDSDSKSSSSSEKEFEETIDFVEIALSRIEREIDNLDKKANNVYKSWSERNSALSKEINKVGDEIALQQSAYNRYMQEANSVGLSGSWAEKVRNGKVDISTIKDEGLAEKIKNYQNWYNKAIECKDAIEELREQESKLYAQRFENIQSQYDAILQGYEHTETMLNEYISQAEAQGHLVSEKYYNALINNEKQNIAELKKEQAELIAARDSGNIPKYTQAWYEQCAAIDEVTQSIEEANTALIEYNNSIRELDWEKFDLIQERISDISAESDFLIDLMSNKDLYDDKGKLTEQGAATMGLHAQNYNVAMYQADEYGKEIANLDKEIVKDPYNQELINRRRELVEAQRESILAAEDEKQAIKDLVQEGIDKELDSLQELIDKKNEELEAEKDLYEYSKQVQEQTENIANLRKSLAAYENDDSEEAKKRIQELKISLEEAETELQETEWDKYIQDTSALLDILYTDYETILNTRLDNIDFLISQVVDGVNAVANLSTEQSNSLLAALGSEGTLAAALGVEGAIASAIVNAMGENGSIKNILNKEATAVGTKLSTAMNSIWSVGEGNAKSVLTTYGNNFQTQQTTTNQTLSGIKISVDKMANVSNKEAEKKVTTNKTTTSAKKDPTKDATTTKNSATTTQKSATANKSIGDGKVKVGDKVKFVSGQYYYDSQGKKPLGSKNQGKQVYITNVNEAKWATHPIHISTGKKLGSGDLGWLKKSQISGYATGKRKILNNEYAWTQEKGQEFIVRPSDGAILTPVAKGDSVLNATASGNIWSMANNPTEFIKNNLGLDSANIPNGATVNNKVTQNFENINFNMPNVHSYNELVAEMQRDPKFEKLILAMTVDQIAGKSKLGKNKAIR